MDNYAELESIRRILMDLKHNSSRPRKCANLLDNLDQTLQELVDKHGDEIGLRLISSIWESDIEPVLMELFSPSYPPYVRKRALSTLGSPNTEKSATLLIEAMSDADPVIQEAAVNELSLWGDPLPEEAISKMVELLGDADRSMRIAAGSALGYIGGARDEPRARQALLRLLLGPLPTNRETTWSTLMAVDDLEDVLSGTETREFADAILSVLMRIQDNKALACWKAGETLGAHLGGEASLDALTQALNGRHACARASAVHGLVHLKDPVAIPFLEKVAKNDHSIKVREYARRVIAYLEDNTSTGDLEYPMERKIAQATPEDELCRECTAIHCSGCNK
jgi:HEAT repeat protein